jgi:hypothetical protein
MPPEDLEDCPYVYIEEKNIGEYKVYIAITDVGGLRIGTLFQLERAHMPALHLVNDGWVTLTVDFDTQLLMHLKTDTGGIYCNLEKDLDINNKVFPFLFMSKISYLALLKRARKYEEEYQKKLLMEEEI